MLTMYTPHSSFSSIFFLCLLPAIDISCIVHVRSKSMQMAPSRWCVDDRDSCFRPESCAVCPFDSSEEVSRAPFPSMCSTVSPFVTFCLRNDEVWHWLSKICSLYLHPGTCHVYLYQPAKKFQLFLFSTTLLFWWYGLLPSVHWSTEKPHAEGFKLTSQGNVWDHSFN